MDSVWHLGRFEIVTGSYSFKNLSKVNLGSFIVGVNLLQRGNGQQLVPAAWTIPVLVSFYSILELCHFPQLPPSEKLHPRSRYGKRSDSYLRFVQTDRDINT